MSRQPPRDPLAIAVRLRGSGITAVAHSDRKVLRAHLATLSPVERVRLRFTGDDLALWAAERLHEMLGREPLPEEHEALAGLCEEAALYCREMAKPDPTRTS